jgi:hypothetical protein
LRARGFQDPNTAALRERVMATPNPASIPACPQCGVPGGHSTNCPVFQQVARAIGFVPEEMQR